MIGGFCEPGVTHKTLMYHFKKHSCQKKQKKIKNWDINRIQTLYLPPQSIRLC